jgi:heterodisulfide reductase subunit A
VIASNKVGSVLVVGGGIGGMQAALDLAESSFKVYLLERGPSIGGVMAMLDKTFPTNDCAMCTMAPRLVEVARHHAIELLTNTEIEKVSGDAGRFEVSVRRKTRYVDESKCTGCGICMEHCPIKTRDEFNQGLSSRPAAYLLFPQAIPRIFTIDRDLCLGCGLCKNLCGPGAIDYQLGDTVRKLRVGAIVAAPGFELFDPKLDGEYGYGRYPNVVTSLEFERILSASGPYRGTILRPSDGRSPKRIAFIQCVGSREETRPWCSSVCCMYATKHSLIAMEHAPGLECTVFYIDLRAFGKGFDAYYNRAKEAGVRYVRCRPSSVKETPGTSDLKIKYHLAGQKPVTENFDMVVLSCGLWPSEPSRDLAGKLGLRLDDIGFYRAGRFAPIETERPGVFVCGPFTDPKDIPETVMQASGSAAKAMVLLASERGRLIEPKEYPPESDVAGAEPRIGVFVCHCGTNIGGVVDVPDVVEYARTLPNVVYAEQNLYTCSTDTQEKIKQVIRDEKLTRVVVASCTPRTHEPLFRNTVREGGLNPYLFEMANIRDQCSWVHMSVHAQATEKSKDLVRMAVAKSALLEPLKERHMKINQDALVVGGGVAGMTAALDLADQGFVVHLVERQNELGGNLRKIRYIADHGDPARDLQTLIARVKKNGNIHLHLGARIRAIDGSLGKFTTKVGEADGSTSEFAHGGVIVAVGADEYKPKEYLYGQSERIITQLELEDRMENGGLDAKRIVMIQCVGSRDAERPYCSRVCCTAAITNALRIKERDPSAEIVILYRDIRTYGMREELYTRARGAGILFTRFEDDDNPRVEANGNGIKVTVNDALLKLPLEIDADLLVLSAGMVPTDGVKELAQLLKVPLNQDGFFLEAHMKLRPVDFATDGVYVCGTAHAPKSVDESIIQASAAAGRATTLLSRESIELEPTISRVIDENCDGCAYCVEPCPYNAITLLEFMKEGQIKKIVESDPSLCKGCGVCMATCPKSGIVVDNFRLDQLSAMVEAALRGA